MAQRDHDDNQVDGSGEQKRYVLVIYTGGTIGMKIDDAGELKPCSGYLGKTLSLFPNFHDPDPHCKITSEDVDVFKDAFAGKKEKDQKIFYLEKTKNNFRIVYGILEFDKLLDSSNMNEHDWKNIADVVFKNYQSFSGFVILHGTDTMAYTSSALSFMFENLGKAVIVTGSQVPLAQLRTDAIENFIGALILAGQFGDQIPEVGLFFNNTLFRGNRTTKVNASGFGAFDSPNYLPLAKIGVDFQLYKNRILPMPKKECTLHNAMDTSVGTFMLFPGITSTEVTAFLGEVKGAVIMSFGAGNGPFNIRHALKNASDEKLMVNITQCLKGEVEKDYATAVSINSGGDMTFEAALTKISHLLAREDLTMEQKKMYLCQDLRGEMTPTL